MLFRTYSSNPTSIGTTETIEAEVQVSVYKPDEIGFTSVIV
jgi:hypothetical protein